MNIVFVSHSAFHPAMVIGSHQLARVYAKAGHRVLHLSLPFSIAHLARLGKPHTSTRLKTALGGVKQREPNLFEWVPLSLIPWDIAKYGLRFSGVNVSQPMAWRIRSMLKRLKMTSVDVALIDESRLVGIENVIRANKTVYRATDLYAQYRGDPRIIDAEKQLIASVDGVFATSHPIADHLTKIGGGCRVDVFNNGFDAEHLAARRPPHASLESVDHPRAVYVGAVDHRFDVESVIGLATLHPSLQVLIYGPVTIDISHSVPANLRFMGSLDYQSLPSVLQHCDVAMLPLRDIPENHGRSPMKYYEYRAAGIPIASLATRSLRAIDSPALFRYENPTAEGLSGAVTGALGATDRTAWAELSPAEKSQSWHNIAERMLERIAELENPVR